MVCSWVVSSTGAALSFQSMQQYQLLIALGFIYCTTPILYIFQNNPSTTRQYDCWRKPQFASVNDHDWFWPIWDADCPWWFMTGLCFAPLCQGCQCISSYLINFVQVAPRTFATLGGFRCACVCVHARILVGLWIELTVFCPTSSVVAWT